MRGVRVLHHSIESPSRFLQIPQCTESHCSLFDSESPTHSQRERERLWEESSLNCQCPQSSANATLSVTGIRQPGALLTEEKDPSALHYSTVRREREPITFRATTEKRGRYTWREYFLQSDWC